MIHVFVSGEVQGVGFRQYIKYQARRLSIKGWVKNLPDGKVEGMFSGSRQDLETMIDFCRRGPYLAKVRNVEIKEIPDEDFFEFKIIKD